MKTKSKVVQSPKFDKSMHGFMPKEKGEVDLVGKLFIRRKRTEDIGTGTLVAGLLFGLDWGNQNEDEMQEVEVNIKPVRRFKDTGKEPYENYRGLRLDQVLATNWGDPKRYEEIK